jgi:hypothetical protein
MRAARRAGRVIGVLTRNRMTVSRVCHWIARESADIAAWRRRVERSAFSAFSAVAFTLESDGQLWHGDSNVHAHAMARAISIPSSRWWQNGGHESRPRLHPPAARSTWPRSSIRSAADVRDRASAALRHGVRVETPAEFLSSLKDARTPKS